MEHHAEIKDLCDDLDVRIDHICEDIRQIPINYKLIDQCYDIDQRIKDIYEWYESTKYMLKQYEYQRNLALEKLKLLDDESKSLNNVIQNIKSQAFSRDQRAVSYSQLHDIPHL